MGCHPADDKEGSPAGTHNISFYCDDIQKTVSELKGRGVEFIDGIEDHGYGLVTQFKMPGDFAVQLYQPRYKRNPPPKPKPAQKKPAKRTAVAKVRKPKAKPKKKRARG